MVLHNGAGLATDATVNEARKIVGTAKRDGRPSSPASNEKQLALAVYDGTVHVGSIIERDDGFRAFDAHGRCVGTFGNQRDAMRAIPRAQP